MASPSDREQQYAKIFRQSGFLAALDQSGGSTPKALRLYGIVEGDYSGEVEMMDRMHEMRTRIIADAAFDGSRILGAILFEMTLDREIEGMPSAKYLWERKRVVPFLKIDKGLAAEADGVQLMKEIPDLDALLDKAVRAGVFGTKERSVIKEPNAAGVKAVVAQQFELGKRICAKGLVPILEPEVDINAAEKAACEELLLEELLAGLKRLAPDEKVIFKLTLPTTANMYKPVIAHPRTLRVVALSGGYSRAQACELLAENVGMTASFSRALTEGLDAKQTDAEFTKALGDSIEDIFQASRGPAESAQASAAGGA